MSLLGVTVVDLLCWQCSNRDRSVGMPGIWQGCGGRGIATIPVNAAVGRYSSGLSWGNYGVVMSTGIPITQRTVRFGSGISSGKMECLRLSRK